MADVDEDVIPRNGPANGEDIDLSDETQDFRFLAAIGADGGKIPKRGEKDFEPHATALQSDTLAASRLAMHNAISIERLHNPKGHSIAHYHPETNMAYMTNPKGVWVPKMGQVLSATKDPIGNDELRGQRLWLLPEEALYLLERGTIDIHWPATDGDDAGVPMSLQAAYTMFLGDEEGHNGALTFERFSVYTALRRGGYTVTRAPTWSSNQAIGAECFPPSPVWTWRIGLSNTLTWFAISKPSSNTENRNNDTIIGPDLYRSYAEVYRRLSLIPFHDPTKATPIGDEYGQTDEQFRVAYYVFKPNNTAYKKSAPPPPDFRLAVVDARKTNVPTLEQLSALLDTTPYQPPPNTPHFYAKLKHGYKNVVLAVVDQGVTSYLKLADCAFGLEKLYDRPVRGVGGKRGGRGGRGRGRGR